MTTTTPLTSRAIGWIVFGYVLGMVFYLQWDSLREVRFLLRSSPNPDHIRTDGAEHADFHKVWPQLQEELCPKMKPNLKIGNALFSLARNEMAKGNFTFPINRFGSDPEMVKLFYSGLFPVPFLGGILYYPPQNASLLYYVRIWKCANDQIRDWISTTLFESLGGQVIDKTSLKAVPRWNDLEQIQKPCIVTAIRDPISHFLSGYNEIEMRLPKNPPQEFKRVQGILPFANAAEGGSIDRFQSFVNDLLGEKGIFKKWVHFQHVFPMMRILPVLAGKDKPLTAYLPSLSNLTFTWPRFVAKACPSMPQKVANIGMQLGGQHESSRDPHGHYRAAKNVWNEGGPAARALCILHALDYACWRDLPDGVPELCQRVFVSPPFVSTVLSTL